jgi:lipopolysaccharide biosynthesis glycosyltransferase
VVLPFEFPPALRTLSPTHYRLFAPVALGATYGRVLYLDVDTYVHTSALFRLFDIDLEGHALAAVRAPTVSFLPDEGELSAVFGKARHPYLNAGVLLLDTRRYADQGLLGRMIGFIRHKDLRLYLDQTLLNMVLQGDWLELSPAFNQTIRVWETWVREVYPPVVVHFAGRRKPWHGSQRVSGHPAAAAMERYFENSPWKSFLVDQQRLYKETDRDRRGPGEYEQRLKLRREMLAYYRETVFADVKAGITVPDLSRIPIA